MYFQRRHTDGKQEHEKMLNITNQKMQIKTTMRYHLTLVRWLSSRGLQITNVGENVEKSEPFTFSPTFVICSPLDDNHLTSER